jgi:hypothetical protein
MVTLAIAGAEGTGSIVIAGVTDVHPPASFTVIVYVPGLRFVKAVPVTNVVPSML